MKPTKKVRIKICCIGSVKEAQLAISHGANAIGLVGQMPSGPGVIDDGLIRKISDSTPPAVDRFLLTSETNVNEIIAHHKRVQTSTIQIVDKIPASAFKKIRAYAPTVRLVQVIHVNDISAIDEAIVLSKYADAILIDSGNPNAKTKTLGGTGNTHDWEISRQIREAIDVPVFLAGGLNAQNIVAAIATVRPFGVDLCSGVRTNGRLDMVKLASFFEAVKSVNFI